MEVFVSGSTDLAEIRTALNKVELERVGADITDALIFAQSLAEGQEGTELVVLSDGNFSRRLSPESELVPRLIAIGEDADNQGPNQPIH